MTTPAYGIGDKAYLRESASLGFLEPVLVSGVTLARAGWLYTLTTGAGQPAAPATFGDRRSTKTGQVLYYDQSELVDLCEALALAEASAQLALDKVKAMRASRCPSQG